MNLKANFGGGYGRLLAHVFIDGQNYNIELVRQGWSKYYTKYGNSELYHAEFVDAENEARERHLNIWDDGSYVSTQKLVTEIYVATFERAPDYDGLMYWTNAVETGSFSIEQVAQSFFDQPETKAKFPQGTSNTEFITAVYYNTLSRLPEAAGLAYWVDALDRGAVRLDQTIMAILNGAKALTGSPADAAMLTKKTEIGLCFADSEIGDLTTHENFMNWAGNIIRFATSSDFNVEEAEEYIAEIIIEDI